MAGRGRRNLSIVANPAAAIQERPGRRARARLAASSGDLRPPASADTHLCGPLRGPGQAVPARRRCRGFRCGPSQPRALDG